jgi:hypothetical protein
MRLAVGNRLMNRRFQIVNRHYILRKASAPPNEVMEWNVLVVKRKVLFSVTIFHLI